MSITYAKSAETLLSALEVNSNIQLFAQQWIQENGLSNIEELFALLDRLQVPYHLVPSYKDARVTEHKLCLMVGEQNDLKIGRFVDAQYQSLDHQSNHFENDTPAKDSLSSFYIMIEDAPLERARADWVDGRLSSFKKLIPKLLLVSFFTNLFALCIPFITMSIYDHVIGGDAGHELTGIAIGASLLFMMMWLLRVLRSKVLATVSHRISREISQALVQKMLANSYAQAQNTPSSSQYAQILISERIAGVLISPLGGTLFDLPFVLLFLIAIGVLGGWLVLVPIISLLSYYLLANHNIKRSTVSSHQSTVAGSNRQNMLNELSSKLTYMRSVNSLAGWLVRFEKANYLASQNGFKQAAMQSQYTAAYYALSVFSTLGVIGLGIGLIFEQQMTAGGLIASMMLISRVTGPAQLLVNSAGRFHALKQSKAQVNRSLQQNAERSFSYQHHPLNASPPSFQLDQVTLRFAKQSKPALSGVSCEIEPGEIVAITGSMGSGKTTLLEVLAGLQAVQSGVVELNSVNLNQYDPQLLRHWSYYRAVSPDLLLLTIREWLDDGHSVTEQAMLDAIERVGGSAWLQSLPEGLDSQLAEVTDQSTFDTLSGYAAKLLIDAKALVHDYPLYLMDNPVPDFTPSTRLAFESLIAEKRGKATLVFTSHDLDLIKQADKVIVLEAGSVMYAGPVNQTEQPLETNDE